MGRDDYGSMQGKFGGMPHYSIERRIGCIAIVTPNFYLEEKISLSVDDVGVVWFKTGKQCNHTCLHCGEVTGTGWVVSQELVDEAVKIADELNQEYTIKQDKQK